MSLLNSPSWLITDRTLAGAKVVPVSELDTAMNDAAVIVDAIFGLSDGPSDHIDS